MKPGLPWSVKGVEPEAREAAKLAARRAGLNLGQWLTRTIMEQSLAQAAPGPKADPARTANMAADLAAGAATATPETAPETSQNIPEPAVSEADRKALDEFQETVTDLKSRIQALTSQLEAQQKQPVQGAFETKPEKFTATDSVEPGAVVNNPYVAEFLSPEAYAATSTDTDDIEQFLAEERSRGRAFAIASFATVLIVGVVGYGYYSLYVKPSFPHTAVAEAVEPQIPRENETSTVVAETAALTDTLPSIEPSANDPSPTTVATESDAPETVAAETGVSAVETTDTVSQQLVTAIESAALTPEPVTDVPAATAPEASGQKKAVETSAPSPTAASLNAVAPAAKGSDDASGWSAYERAMAYAEGDGVAADPGKAADLFETAANTNHRDAQYRLALAYHEGKGRPSDLQRALVWMHRAAEAGHIEAQYRLGVIYATSTGVTQDYSHASRWFEKAARAGHRDAQYNLGVLYSSGEGLIADDVDAYKWFSLAATQNDSEAARRRDALQQSMLPQDLAHAKALAAAWQVRQAGNNTAQPAVSANIPQTTAEPLTGAVSRQVETEAPQTKRIPERTGTKGQAHVRQVQIMLRQLGFNPGPADGIAGETTREAIKQFENANGLTETGRLTPTLVDSLAAAVE